MVRRPRLRGQSERWTFDWVAAALLSSAIGAAEAVVMKVHPHAQYRWDGTRIPYGRRDYGQRLEALLRIARVRNRSVPENRKLDIDEWPTVGEPFTWRPNEPAAARNYRHPSLAGHRGWIKAAVFWLLLLTGTGIASALFAPEAASFVVGKLATGNGNDIAERIWSRL
jgi:hypothetical protein